MSTRVFTLIRANADMGCCSSSFNAPLWRSPENSLMATNGSKNAAANSQALKVGAQMPTSGENASPTPVEVPPRPLASAYVCTALINETPTSGPIRMRKAHHARDASNSRHSLLSSHAGAELGERKKDLLKTGLWSTTPARCQR